MDLLTRAPRFKVDLEVTIKKLFTHNDDIVKIKNISLSGAFIEMSTDGLNPQELVGLNFVVGTRERVVQSLIVWKSSEGIGVQFCPMSYLDQSIIDELIFLLESKKVGPVDN